MSDELNRIADAMERLAPISSEDPNFSENDVYLWGVMPDRLEPVPDFNTLSLELLHGIKNARDTLLRNTEQFAKGFPANNALLWGARGMGKSSLIKAVYCKVLELEKNVKLIEIQREDLPSISRLLIKLKKVEQRFILFCDDLSFNNDDASYKSLKAVLDGGVDGTPENVIFYATSNRRHLMPRDMIENERSSAINPGEAIEEKVSLSDRFGLWLGFHSCDQETYLDIVTGYCNAYALNMDIGELHSEAIKWQATRGSRSGRVAWQYFLDLAGRKGIKI
jgi:predicted AAA+ superfamily ATPase|tara:strand:- start:374 stop:1210 length:837 start_codon:yes stop_codon:yes gene_type:complete